MNGVDSEGKSALVWAVQRNELALVSLFIGKGADLNLLDSKLRDCLEYAMQARNVRLVKLLLKNGASTAAGKKRTHFLMELVCETGDEELLEVLVERGASLLDKDSQGRNIMMRAYLADRLGLVRRLLESYSFKNHINYLDLRGNSMLNLAISREDSITVKSLLEHCPNLLLDQRNAAGQTPLLQACELEAVAIVLLLVPRMNSTLLNMSDKVALVDPVQEHRVALGGQTVREYGGSGGSPGRPGHRHDLQGRLGPHAVRTGALGRREAPDLPAHARTPRQRHRGADHAG